MSDIENDIEDHLSSQAIIRRRLAKAEMECAQGLARITHQRELILQGMGGESGHLEQRLAQLMVQQAELERHRDRLQSKVVRPAGTTLPVARQRHNVP